MPKLAKRAYWRRGVLGGGRRQPGRTATSGSPPASNRSTSRVHSLDPDAVGSDVDDQLADDRRHTEMR